MDKSVILHLGLGSFHRAHQAVYLHRLIEQGDDGWMIVAGNLRPDMADTVAALQRQGGEYTLETVRRRASATTSASVRSSASCRTSRRSPR